MEESKTTDIVDIKREVRFREWEKQIKAQQSSGGDASSSDDCREYHYLLFTTVSANSAVNNRNLLKDNLLIPRITKISHLIISKNLIQ